MGCLLKSLDRQAWSNPCGTCGSWAHDGARWWSRCIRSVPLTRDLPDSRCQRQDHGPWRPPPA
ncbi:MAG: hypothetical protein DWI46_03850, partial [Chloroflexi bacterium]